MSVFHGVCIIMMLAGISMGQNDSCVVDYKTYHGHFTSLNRSCEYTITSQGLDKGVEVRLENFTILANSSIVVMLTATNWKDQIIIETLTANSTRDTRYFLTASVLNILKIRTNGDVLFYASFKPYVDDRVVNLEGTEGMLLSPYYPQSYKFDVPNELTVVYHVKVPRGHAKLNFTVVDIPKISVDSVEVYDGKYMIWPPILTYGGDIEVLHRLHVVVGTSNYLTVKFKTTGEKVDKINRFKAIYSMDTNVIYCKALKMPNAHAERDLTLPGHKTAYICDTGYYSPDRSVERTCISNGVWRPGGLLICKAVCPSFDDNSKLVWDAWNYDEIYAGVNVTFTGCSDYGYDLIGPKRITCTSDGTYSPAPPVCRKSDNSSNNYWIYGAGAGGASVVILIILVVLRVWLRCFLCVGRTNRSTGSSLVPDSTVPYGKA